MPAAAVIPAPRVYICVAAVEKLVVGSWSCWVGGFGVWDSVPAPVKYIRKVCGHPHPLFLFM